jgi:hypothetical protein
VDVDIRPRWAGLGCQESKTVPVRHWLGLDERGRTLKRRLNEWHAATCRASKLQIASCKLYVVSCKKYVVSCKLQVVTDPVTT